MSKYIWLIDNGHGVDTKGKCSPIWADGSRLIEYSFNRKVAHELVKMCEANNINVKSLVPETNDISLGERVRRANEIQINHPEKTCILISIHGNAAGVESATGVEVFTTKGETKSDAVASIFLKELEKELQWKMRKDFSDGDPDKESDFYILAKTSMPAILTENGFYTNEEECRMMLDPTMQRQIAYAHFAAIKQIESEQKI